MNSFHFEWVIESLMHKIIFICTANIFRSRFSEEVYNFLAKKNNLSSRAFSAGLKVGNYEMCFACRMPLSKSDKSDIHFVEGKSCRNCFNKTTEKQKQRFNERQKQILLHKINYILS